jgi:hypothetical protein
LRLALDNERAERLGELFFTRNMFNQRHYCISPRLGVLKPQIVSIRAKKKPYRCEGRPLVALFERMGLCDAGHQPDGEDDDILFSVRKSILRTCQGAFKQSLITKKMLLAGYDDQRSINFNDRLD